MIVMAGKPLIVGVGEALYGSIWASDMARDIGVGKRTTARYASGEREPGDDTLRRLRRIAVARVEVLRALIEELPE